MNVLLLADPHFGHQLAATIRGFSTIEEHDWTIQENIRHALRGYTSPEVWWLGDIAFGGWREGIKFVGTLPGVHRLIVGNHDRVFAGHSRAYDYQREFLTVFDSVQQMARLSHEGQGFVLSHFPYSEGGIFDHAGRRVDKYDQWRPRDCGKPLIHGHTHSRRQFSLSAAGTPQVHVGVDAWGFGPVRLDEAAALLNRKDQVDA